MKKSVHNKTVFALLAILTSASAAQAEGGVFTIQNPTAQQQEFVSELIKSGYIFAFDEYPNWYQINYERLAAASNTADREAVKKTVFNLKSVLGDQVSIREVQIQMAAMGSQAFAAVAKTK